MAKEKSKFDRKVVSHIAPNSVYPGEWAVTLECGHKKYVRTRSDRKKPPTESWCSECYLNDGKENK